MQYDKITQRNLCTVKWAQCDKTQFRELLRTAHRSVLMTAQLQYTIQHELVLIISCLTSRQTS